MNGEEVKGTEIWVERSTTDRLKLRVEAEGYEPYEASPLPVSDLYINVPLTRQRGSMERPGHRRSGSHAAMAMEPAATEAMPADPRTPPAEMRVKRFNEL